MNSVERLLRVLAGEPVDRAPVIGLTSVVTVDLMRQVDTQWPDAHHDPEQMVRAGAAAHVVCGLESVKVPFDMTVEAGALGADIDFGGNTTLPKIRAPLFESPEEFMVGEDLMTRGRFPIVLEAIRIARKQHGEAAPVITSGGSRESPCYSPPTPPDVRVRIRRFRRLRSDRPAAGRRADRSSASGSAMCSAVCAAVAPPAAGVAAACAARASGTPRARSSRIDGRCPASTV